jgi:glycosyltransferase involved in cell wall biosynthesis
MKISVVVTSFNHEKYITQCLESILSQKGDFQMEIIIGDDCSTDHSRVIAEQFQAGYPQVISILPAGPNLGITKNLKRCLDACSGDYIAICEGDDYWTDTHKLQKQMLFLESHTDFSMCFSAIMIYFEDRNRFEPYHDQLAVSKGILTTEELIEHNLIGNFSCCMYRTEVIRKLPDQIFDFFTVDWMFNICCSQLGKVGFLHDWMSVYRKHATGAWAGKSELESLYQMLPLIDTYNEFLGYKYDVHFKNYKARVLHLISISQDNGRTNSHRDASNMPLPPLARTKSWLGQRGRSVYRKTRAAGAQVWNNTLKPILRPSVRRVRSLKARLNQQVRITLHRLRKLKTRQTDLLILDTIFPHPLSPFRFHEFIKYLHHFPRSMVLSTGEHLPALKEKRSIAKIIEEFEEEYRHLKGRTAVITHTLEFYDAKLAYAMFLYNMNVFLDALEEKEIPFVFTLYPGGGFEIDKPKSDAQLARILKSPQFRKVIVTQKITYDYLIRKGFCLPEQIEFIYGVVTPMPLVAAKDRKIYFGIEKHTLDICFVAHKYMERGIDKGYDVFIESAKKISRQYKNIHFHVVGSFTETDIPIEDLKGKITFYGLQKPEWFDQFYLNKDIILSPNIPFTLLEGSFDGFPTASCTEAGLRNVAMFCTDELNLNIKFIHGADIVIIPHESDKIVDILKYYYDHPLELRTIAENGAARIQEVYSDESQILPRIRILEKELQEVKDRTRSI